MSLDIRQVVIPMEVGEDAMEGLCGFQQLLEQIILIRLGTSSDKPVVHPISKEPWKIAHINVFKDKNYILAAILDPRQKSSVFNST